MITPKESLAKLELVKKKIAKSKKHIKTAKYLLNFRKDKDSEKYKADLQKVLLLEKDLAVVENDCNELENEIKLQIKVKKRKCR